MNLSRIAAMEHLQRNNVQKFLKAQQLDAHESSELSLPSCGASDSSARTMARAERRFGMASIARSNANATPDVSLELARFCEIH